MAQVKTRPRKTVDDYMKLPEGTRAELIEGDLFMSPSPKDWHQEVLFILAKALSAIVEAKGLGKVWIAPFDVHLPSGDIVQPDILYISQANSHIVRGWVRGVPDLVIEVLSPDSHERDRIVKRALYARNRVPEYWIVDEKGVDVLELSASGCASRGYFEGGDTLTSGVLADLALPVRSFLPSA